MWLRLTRMHPYSGVSLYVTDELKELSRSYSRLMYELCVADVLNIGQLDGGREWFGRAGWFWV